MGPSSLRPALITTQWLAVRLLAVCRVRFLGWLVVACCIGWLTARGDERPETDLHLANDRLQATRLVDIAEDSRLEFQVAGQSRAISAAEIVRWGAMRPSGGAPLVWLHDGSWLVGQIRWKSPQVLELISDWFVPIELDIERVRGIMFQPPTSLRQWAELVDEMRNARGAEDIIWTAVEQISGVVTMSLHRVDAAESALIPEWKLAKPGRPGLVMDNAELRAILFSPVLRPPLAAVPRGLQVGLRDGSRLNVSAMVRKSQQVTVGLADNYHLQSLDASMQFAEAIVSLTGNPSGIQWLGEMEPARYRIITEDSQLNWPLGRDRDLFKQKLWKSGQPVDHGVCMHAPSQAAYRWDGTPGKLLAELSLLGDPRESSVGSIEGKVLLARGGMLQEVYVSSVLRSTSAAEHVTVDLADAQLVVLLVGAADQGPIGDHALWREARLVRQAQP